MLSQEHVLNSIFDSPQASKTSNTAQTELGFVVTFSATVLGVASWVSYILFPSRNDRGEWVNVGRKTKPNQNKHFFMI